MLKLLLVGMVVSVCITALTLISYLMMFDSVAPSTIRPARYKGGKLRTADEYPVLIGSAIESQFLTLEVTNCSMEIIKPSDILWNNDYWQVVNNSNIYLYTAFYDVRFTYLKDQYHFVRILGMSMGKIVDETYYCILWYNHQPISVEAEATEVWLQHWNRNPDPDTYHTYLFSCPIPLTWRDSGTYPSYVSLSSEACSDLTNKLTVNRDELDTSNRRPKQNFAVCVKGMDFVNDLSLRLLEWLELIFILGAEKITFYKFRMHKNMEKVLNYYEKHGRVSVIPLSLPGEQPNDPEKRTLYLKRAIWQKRRNEIVPYNDCLYKNMYNFKYVIPLDIDEVIVPVKTYTWLEMLQGYQEEKPEVFQKYASFSAQNTYFLDIYNSTHTPNVPSYYHMLQSKIRSANFSLFGHSVKSFVSTELSKAIFNHYTLEPLYASKKTNHVMNTSHVQMNHYKERCPREIYSQCQSKFLVYTKQDNTIDKYKKKLIQNVESVIKKLNLSIKPT